MFKSYLPRAFQYYALLLILFLFIIASYKILSITVLFFLFLNFSYRKKIFNVEDYIDTRGFEESVLCPISGYVSKLYSPLVGPYSKKSVCIEISSSLHFETGLFLPTKSEVQEFILDTKDGIINLGYLDYNYLKQNLINCLSIVFNDKHKNKIVLEFPRRMFLPWPKIWMMPGDRGKVGANIGHLPFGGKVYLYLPINYEILVTKGDKVTATSTMIAALAQGLEQI